MTLPFGVTVSVPFVAKLLQVEVELVHELSIPYDSLGDWHLLKSTAPIITKCLWMRSHYTRQIICIPIVIILWARQTYRWCIYSAVTNVIFCLAVPEDAITTELIDRI